MSTYTSATRQTFYAAVWPRALVDGKTDWCRLTELSGGTPVLVPLDNPGLDLPWPALETGEPGWIPTAGRIQAAFARALGDTPPALGLGHVGDNDARRRLRLAEQHVDADGLRSWVADLLLQVAVFGQVVMS
jgi:hypothetical protein